MSPHPAVLAIVPLALGLGGCEQHDIGRACPELLGGQKPYVEGETRVETLEVVAQDLQFPCDELICIATDGKSGYCSKKCRENAGCPPGFECRQVQRIGEFANDKFCAWKHCNRPRDCGDRDEFRCRDAPSAEAGEELKLCEFRED